MNTLTHIAKGMWQELTQAREFPTAAVRENLLVAEDALYMANRVKKENPDYAKQVLLETARLLDITLNK